MKIRPLRETDISAVIALWNDCALTRPWNNPEKDIRFALEGATSTILIGEEQGQTIASVMVGHDGHRGALYYLAIAPNHQGRGYGRAIHDAAVEWLQKHGVWKINLLVRAGNERVVGFYEGLGYAENGAISLGKQLGAPKIET